MPTTVIKTNVTWQGALAIDHWVAANQGADCVLILEDVAVRSLWVSKTNTPLEGAIEIDLWQTIQADLLRKVERFLALEARLPGRRDDWLFEILHHPVLGLDKMLLAMQAVRFYRLKKERSFQQYLLKDLASLDHSGEPVRAVVESLQRLRDLVKGNGNTREAVLEFLLHKASNQKSVLILEGLASADRESAFLPLTLDDANGIHLKAAVPEAINARQVLICDFSKKESDTLPDGEVTWITSPNAVPQSAEPIPLHQPKVRLLPDNWLADILANYTLSVSHLNTLLRCPLSFYFEVILRSPAGKHPSMAFGAAVHDVMEKAFRKMLQHADRQFPGIDEIHALFERSMEKYRAFFGEADYAHKLEYGKQVLQRHFRDFADEWSRIATIERHVKANIGGVPVHGFIDKIEFDHYRAIIVDYKTGKAAGKGYRFIPPGHEAARTPFEQTYGGNYWRQAVFYYLLVHHDHTTKWKPSKVVFEYLEPENRSEKRIEIKPGTEEQKLVKAQIQLAWQTIEARVFDTGCGEADCRWCRFVAETNYP